MDLKVTSRVWHSEQRQLHWLCSSWLGQYCNDPLPRCLVWKPQLPWLGRVLVELFTVVRRILRNEFRCFNRSCPPSFGDGDNEHSFQGRDPVPINVDVGPSALTWISFKIAWIFTCDGLGLFSFRSFLLSRFPLIVVERGSLLLYDIRLGGIGSFAPDTRKIYSVWLTHRINSLR